MAGSHLNIQSLLNQFLGGQSVKGALKNAPQMNGFAGGAAAGGVLALLASNKKARKMAGKAATVGGAAVLGGLAYAALKNWQQEKQNNVTVEEPAIELSQDFELKLVKTMIAAANADGHFDQTEQQRIFSAMDDMPLSDEYRNRIFDLIRYPESPETLARDVQGLEQASEMYLMANFAIDVDTPEERTFLKRLAAALSLPEDLTVQLDQQAIEFSKQPVS